MPECIFCKIIKREIPSTLVYEDEAYVAFEDIHPKAPVHVLVVPKVHIESVNSLTDKEQGLAGGLMLAAKRVAEKLRIAKAFQLKVYVGAGAGQNVFHIHMHVLGGWTNPPNLE